MAQPKVIVYKELQISEHRPRIRDVYQIVGWNDAEPQFEIRRQFKNKEEDGWRYSHARGVRKADLEWIKEHWDEIENYLNKACEVWKESK